MVDRELHKEGTKDRVKGAGKAFEGKVRKNVGDLTDDHSEEFKGKAQELKGKAQKKWGEAQQKAARKDGDDDRP